jgi:cytochrome c oxidase subunit 3
METAITSPAFTATDALANDRQARADSGRETGHVLPPGTHRLGMVLGLSGIGMLFVALTSAYVVRRGLGGDWRAMEMPPVLWFNTAVLVISSLTFERARRVLRVSRFSSAYGRWLSMTLLLGLLFLGGQVAAWAQLSGAGVYLSSNPHSSFLYTLTGLHGLHLLGGVVAIGFLALRGRIDPKSAGDGSLRRVAKLERSVDVTVLYWHFMDGLWIYLLVLLFA